MRDCDRWSVFGIAFFSACLLGDRGAEGKRENSKQYCRSTRERVSTILSKINKTVAFPHLGLALVTLRFSLNRIKTNDRFTTSVGTCQDEARDSCGAVSTTGIATDARHVNFRASNKTKITEKWTKIIK